MLNFNALPQDKPNNNTVSNGRYNAVVFKTQKLAGKESGVPYLNVSFKLDNGGFVNENYFDSDKPFLQYKLGRLLKACNVSLSGEGTLDDVAKVIKDKRVIIDVAVNDRGYGALDYSGANEGIYPPNAVPAASADVVMQPEVSQAIEANVNLDEDF